MNKSQKDQLCEELCHSHLVHLCALLKWCSVAYLNITIHSINSGSIWLALLFSWLNICMLLAGSIFVWSCWSVDQQTWWTFLCVKLIISTWLVLESLQHSLCPLISPFLYQHFIYACMILNRKLLLLTFAYYLFSAVILNSLMNARVGHLESCINKIFFAYSFGSLQDQTIAGLSSKYSAVIAYYPSKSGAPQPAHRGEENSLTLLSFTSDLLCSLGLNHHKHRLHMPRSIPPG